MVKWYEALGWTLALLSSVPALLQVERTWRTRSVDGVSAATHVAWTFSWVGWGVYGAAVGSWPVVVESLAGLCVEVVQLRLLRGLGVDLTAAARRWAPVVALLLFGGWVAARAGVVAGAEAIAVALTVFDAVGVVPQTVKAWRDPSSEGLSAWAWAAGAALAAGWVVYALAIGHPWAASWSVLAGISSTVVLAAKFRRRQLAA